MQKRDYKPSRKSTHAQSQWAAALINKEATHFQPGSGTYPQFKGWLHHLCSSPFTPSSFQRRRLPCIGNSLWGDLHAMVQINDNSANFLSLLSLSAHTWYVGFLLPLACQGLLQEILSDVLHQGEYNRGGLYQPCLFALTAWLCLSSLPSPRVP